MVMSDENPEEFGLIKCTKIVAGPESTANSDNIINTNSSQGEEKK